MPELPARLRPPRRRRATLAAALLCAWCAALSGCGVGPPGGARSLRPLRIALYGPALGLDPHFHNEFVTALVLGNVYEGLTALDAQLRLRPCLAISWETPSDRVWRFHLRPGVRFHDGSVFDADDVVASLDRARRHPKSQFQSFLAAVIDVHAVDPATVEITTDRPYAVLLNKLAFVFVLPAGAPPEVHRPDGTGPYRFDGRDADGTIRLAGFDGYWGGAPAERSVELLSVPSDEKRIRMLANDEVDLVESVPPAEVGRVAALPGCHVVAEDSLIVEHLEIRTDTPPFDDLRVRQAIDLAVDRELLVARTLAGQGRPAGQLVGPGVVGYDPALEPHPRDLAAARRLLAEAGHPDGVDVTLELREGRDAAELVRQLGEAGIRVTLRPQPQDRLFARLDAGEIAFHLGGFLAESADASDLFDTTVHSRDPARGLGDGNTNGYANPELDARIEESGRILDPLARREALQRCMRMLMRDLPLVPLWVPYELYGVRQGLAWEPRVDGSLVAATMSRDRAERGVR